mmetsp:Transcript_20828/g.34894  ORF Transcript_20828/g.34894 Transcript_20828/m.34894 type:complete len:1053 (+) Transcript_20828:50-3208(+)
MSASSVSSQQPVMMEIEIKFSRGRTDRVLVHYDDSPDDLAKSFVARHKLKESSVPIISKYIQDTIDNYTKNPRKVHENDSSTPTLINPAAKSSGKADSTAYDSEGQKKHHTAGTNSPKSNHSDSVEAPVPVGRHSMGRGSGANTPEFYLGPDASSTSSLDKLAHRSSGRNTPDSIGFGSGTGSVSHPNKQRQSRVENMEEADILRSISRSLSIDHKQYQENLDRRISMRNFSYKGIAAELVASAEDTNQNNHHHDPSHGVSDTASDASTVRRVRSTSPSVHDTPPAFLVPSIASGPVASSVSSSGGGGGDVHTVGIAGKIASTPNSEDLEFSCIAPTGDEEAKTGQHDVQSNERRSNNKHSMNDNVDDGNLSLSDGSISSQNDSPEVDAEAAAEAMFNRLKQQRRIAAGGGGGAGGGQQQPYHHQHAGASSSASASGAAKVLKPSSHSMHLGIAKSSLGDKQAQQQQLNSGSGGRRGGTRPGLGKSAVVGKTTAERLYIDAQLERDKRQRQKKALDDREAEQIELGKFKLNKKSAVLVEQMRPKQFMEQHENVGARLHAEGTKEKELKEKRSKSLIKQLAPEEWSCVKCGSFHSISRASVTIQPLHQIDTRAQLYLHLQEQQNATGDNKSNKQGGGKDAEREMRTCEKCGWEQSKEPTFQPVNIALSLSNEADELLKSRFNSTSSQTGDNNEEGAAAAADVHEYLYKNARSRQNILQLNRVLWQEANSDLTFAPAIPEASLELLERYRVEEEAAENQNPDLPVPPPPASKSKGQGKLEDKTKGSEEQKSTVVLPNSQPAVGSAGNKNLLAGPALGAYFKRPAMERLSTTYTRAATSSDAMRAEAAKHHPPLHHPYTAGDIKHKNNKKSNGNKESPPDTRKLSPTSRQGRFTNRLTYEYKEKEKRTQEVSERNLKYDPVTNQKLFQPVIGPNPSDALSLGTTISTFNSDGNNHYNGGGSRRRDIFDLIRRKDEALREKKKKAEEEAVENMMKDLRKHRVKALDSSQQILKESTEHNIEELYQVLLEAQEPLMDQSAHREALLDAAEKAHQQTQ